MSGIGRRRWRMAVGALMALAVVVAAATGTSLGKGRAAGGVAANPFAHYGNITLNVWSADNQDPGPEPVIKTLTKQFEKKYPNVKINLKFYGFTNYIKIIQLALNSSSAPDVAEGNQGYQIDSLLVKAKLIRPLDSYAKKYGWNKLYTPGTAAQFRWTTDGKTYGKGPLWGVAQFGQSTGLFYNKAKLKALGITTLPTTFSGFDKMLAQIKAKQGSSTDPILVIGNLDKYEALHAFGMVQGAYVPAKSVRNWIFHVPGSTYSSQANVNAITKFDDWVKAGYFGTNYNAVGENIAASQFAKGAGIFYMGGNWQAQVIRAGLGANAGFMDMPPATPGKYAAIGSASLPWHVSSKSKYPDVGAAYINWLISAPGSAKLMYAQNQIPAILGAPPAKGNPYLTSVAQGWQKLVKADGLSFFPDWASPTMLDTLGSNFQEMMAGREAPADAAKAIQADWTKFDKQIKSK